MQPTIYSGPAFAGLRIGLMGGSFNPAHAVHLAMSRHAMRALQLDQIWWLVSPQNPLKDKGDMAPLEERLKNAQNLAYNRIIVTAIEQKLGTSYTIDTLRQLKKRFPRTDFVWLMGADNLMQLPRWKAWAQIMRLVPVAVFRRPAYAAGRGRGKAAQRFGRFWQKASRAKNLAGQKTPAWMVLNNQLMDLSASMIRQRQKEEEAWQKQKRKS